MPNGLCYYLLGSLSTWAECRISACVTASASLANVISWKALFVMWEHCFIYRTKCYLDEAACLSIRDKESAGNLWLLVFLRIMVPSIFFCQTHCVISCWLMCEVNTIHPVLSCRPTRSYPHLYPYDCFAHASKQGPLICRLEAMPSAFQDEISKGRKKLIILVR